MSVCVARAHVPQSDWLAGLLAGMALKCLRFYYLIGESERAARCLVVVDTRTVAVAYVRAPSATVSVM